jgi:uracil-DNA glycosylase
MVSRAILGSMPSVPLDDQRKRAIAARIQFYRDLGIHSFYRRGPAGQVEVAPEEHAAETLPIIQAVKSVGGSVLVGKASEMQIIRDDLGDCTRCRLATQGRKQIVWGVGNLDADIFFVGEGPGADEDLQGEPFVGRAGQLLNNMISAMGIEREDVYIANVVKCRPPGNRTPERDECDTCSPFLIRQIETVKPKVIVALGAVAAKTLLQVSDSMANLRGRLHDFRGIPLAVTYHPAYLLRDPRQKKEAWRDLQMVMRHLGMKPPKQVAPQSE